MTRNRREEYPCDLYRFRPFSALYLATMGMTRGLFRESQAR